MSNYFPSDSFYCTTPTHSLYAALDPTDADVDSPNFPYARQDKKDKVRWDGSPWIWESHADGGLVESTH